MPSDASYADDEPPDDQATPQADTSADPYGPNLGVTQNALLGGNYFGDYGVSQPSGAYGGSYGTALGTNEADPQIANGSSVGDAAQSSLATGFDPTGGLVLSLPQLNRILGDGSVSSDARQSGAWRSAGPGAPPVGSDDGDEADQGAIAGDTATNPMVGRRSGVAGSTDAVAPAEAESSAAQVLPSSIRVREKIQPGSKVNPSPNQDDGAGRVNASSSAVPRSGQSTRSAAGAGRAIGALIWPNDKGEDLLSRTDSRGCHRPILRVSDPDYWTKAEAERAFRGLAIADASANNWLAGAATTADWVRGADERDVYRDALTSGAVGQTLEAAVGGAGARPEEWAPEGKKFEPVGGTPNGLDAGVTWRGGIRDQGIPWERELQRQYPGYKWLPSNSNTWDLFDKNTGHAISAKVINTMASKYTKRPANLFNVIRGYVRSAAVYDGRGRNSAVGLNEIKAREVNVAVSHYTTPEQWMQISRARIYARSQGVVLNITPIK